MFPWSIIDTVRGKDIAVTIAMQGKKLGVVVLKSEGRIENSRRDGKDAVKGKAKV